MKRGMCTCMIKGVEIRRAALTVYELGEVGSLSARYWWEEPLVTLPLTK